MIYRDIRNSRFGDKCSRRGCRYIHGDNSDAARDFGDGDSWLPFRINITLNADGSVSVVESELNNEGTNYELTAIVCVIQVDGEFAVELAAFSGAQSDPSPRIQTRN